MKKLKIYLTGNMTPIADYYKKWTKEFKDSLLDNYDCAIAVQKTDQKFIVRHDLARLKKCDILVINFGVLDIRNHITGAIVEVYEAYKSDIPVYAFTEENVQRSEQADSPWIQHFITHEFKSPDDLILHLLFDENLLI